MSDGDFFKWVIGGIFFAALMVWLIITMSQNADVLYKECMADGKHTERYCKLLSNTAYHSP